MRGEDSIKNEQWISSERTLDSKKDKWLQEKPMKYAVLLTFNYSNIILQIERDALRRKLDMGPSCTYIHSLNLQNLSLLTWRGSCWESHIARLPCLLSSSPWGLKSWDQCSPLCPISSWVCLFCKLHPT